MRTLEEACRAAGLAIGRQRLAIIRVLQEATDHPTADQIHERARLYEPGMSQATVYRTLALFEDQGLAFALEFGDRKMRYEDATRGPHDHLIDADTGEISNFTDDQLQAAVREVLAQRGLELRGYRLDVLCRKVSPAQWTKTLARRVTRTG